MVCTSFHGKDVLHRRTGVLAQVCVPCAVSVVYTKHLLIGVLRTSACVGL